MNTLIRFGKIALFCMISTLVAFTSCLSENDETIALKEHPRAHAYSSFINKDGLVTFVFNTGNGSDAYIITDNDGKIEKMNLVFTKDKGTDYGTIFFYNGMIRSITIKDVTYTFSKNKEGKLDAAVTSNGYTELFTNIGEASYISFEDETNLGMVFGCISNAVTLIKKINDLVEPDSFVFPYLSGINDLLSDVDDSSTEFSDSDISEDLVENAEDGVENEDIDWSGVKENENGAEDNTDVGNGAIISGIGALKVTLTWKFTADIDLHVYEPGYKGSIPSSSSAEGHIYYSNKRGSFTDGYLDIDNTSGYYIDPITGDSNKRLSAVENIYWTENPLNGTFYVYLHYYAGSVSGPCTVTVYKNGKGIFSKTVDMSSAYKNTQLFICKVSMPSGTISETRSVANEDEAFDYLMLPSK